MHVDKQALPAHSVSHPVASIVYTEKVSDLWAWWGFPTGNKSSSDRLGWDTTLTLAKVSTGPTRLKPVSNMVSHLESLSSIHQRCYHLRRGCETTKAVVYDVVVQMEIN